jgi:hypothetical protein
MVGVDRFETETFTIVTGLSTIVGQMRGQRNTLEEQHQLNIELILLGNFSMPFGS